MTPTLTPPEMVAPAADERCDRCSAAGKLRIRLAGAGELVFCGHHANKYAEQLVTIAVAVAADPDFSRRCSSCSKPNWQRITALERPEGRLTALLRSGTVAPHPERHQRGTF